MKEKKLKISDSTIFILYVALTIAQNELLPDHILAMLGMFIITILYAIKIIKQKPDLSTLLDKEKFNKDNKNNESSLFTVFAIFAIVSELFRLVTSLLYKLNSNNDSFKFIVAIVLLGCMVIFTIIRFYTYSKIGKNARNNK